eukprot:GEMP01017687.1.p1 GENE.GEMP01017687.1~~GEMP01017687.1.p1  ORF type:complete len:546 (+),score=124.26 GEMP01017687.1:38-1675(+)
MWWLVAALVASSDVAVTINARLSLSKNDDKQFALAESRRLIQVAKENKFHTNMIVFLQNLEVQLNNLVETAAKVEKEKNEGPAEFTTGKHKVKPLKKLRAKPGKKNAIQTKTMDEFVKMAASPDGLKFDAPFVIRNATGLFKDWEGLQRHWAAARISGDDKLEKNLKIPYRAPGSPIYRFENNMRYWIPPQKISFSRYVTNCFLGTPAAPKIPGQATEHCEKSIASSKIASAKEMEAFNIFSEFKNMFKDLQQFNTGFINAGKNNSFEKSMGDKASNFFDEHEQVKYQSFTFGPSGSGDKLNQEDYLPFFDVLIHGSRRWLLLTEAEFIRIRDKAKEALEFHETSAYMFFEEKLPELKDEFDLKQYVEANQDTGDVMFVPDGWFRVSLSLADSISYNEQLIANAATVTKYLQRNTWLPRYNSWDLAYCFEPKDIVTKTGGLSSEKDNKWLFNEFYGVGDDAQITSNILKVMVYCGSVMASPMEFAKGGLRETKCLPKIWTDCRKRFLKHAKRIKKASELDFKWLPKTPPSHDTEFMQPTEARDEL